MDIKDVIENIKRISVSENALKLIMDVERVLDSLDIYVFANWDIGELVDGPNRSRHWIDATFMWPESQMPDPDGGLRLLEYDIKVEYAMDRLVTPVQVKGYEDFRPGKRKPKLQEDPVWLVKFRFPVEMIEDIADGFLELEGEEIDMGDIQDIHNRQGPGSEFMRPPDRPPAGFGPLGGGRPGPRPGAGGDIDLGL